MKFFIFDEEGMATSLAFRLQELEKQEVRFFSQKAEGKEHLLGMVPHVKTMEEGLRWVGNDGYVICGDEQDTSWIRRRGFKVYGGNAFTARLENDRVFEMTVAQKAGIRVPNFHQIQSVEEGIRFIKENPDQYCLKQTGHAPKTWNYVGKEEDGSDVVDQLEWIKMQPEFKRMGKVPFLLQEFVEGIEFACAAWWQYTDWLRGEDGSILLELNREHKKQGNGDSGLTTGEMGTVGKIVKSSKLFDEVLNKLAPVLRQNASDICLDVDVNCGITDNEGAFLYEITPREGYPAAGLTEYMFDTPMSEFFVSLIDRQRISARWKPGWGVITVLGAGQFPHEGSQHEGAFKNQPVKFPFNGWNAHVTPFYIKWDKQKKYYRVADYYEYVCGVTYNDADIGKANEQCVKMMKEIDVRAPQYRTDIGEKFQTEELPKLQKMGYVTE